MRFTGITKLFFPSVGLTMRDLVNAIAVAMVEAAEGKRTQNTGAAVLLKPEEGFRVPRQSFIKTVPSFSSSRRQ